MQTTKKAIKSKYGINLKPSKVLSQDGIIAPFDNALGDSKTFHYNDVNVESPIGVLCTLSQITATIFRANHSGGGYDCYLSILHAIYAGRGHTSASFVNDKPPGGLALALALLDDQDGVLGIYNLTRQDVGCGDRGRVVGQRIDSIDPDLFPLTTNIMIMVGASSWYPC